MIIKSGNTTHDTNVAAAELTRQVAVKAASTQAAVNTAEIAFYRTCLASAIANNCQTSEFLLALRQLGVTGL